MYKIFVYGTLKKGGSNHYFLRSSKFIKKQTLKDHSIFVPSGYGFPLLLEDKGGKDKKSRNVKGGLGPQRRHCCRSSHRRRRQSF